MNHALVDVTVPVLSETNQATIVCTVSNSAEHVNALIDTSRASLRLLTRTTNKAINNSTTAASTTMDDFFDKLIWVLVAVGLVAVVAFVLVAYHHNRVDKRGIYE